MGNDKLLLKKNIAVQLSQGIQNIHRIKVAPITYTLEKKFSAVATFQGLRVVSFQTEQKNGSILWSA